MTQDTSAQRPNVTNSYATIHSDVADPFAYWVPANGAVAVYFSREVSMHLLLEDAVALRDQLSKEIAKAQAEQAADSTDSEEQ